MVWIGCIQVETVGYYQGLCKDKELSEIVKIPGCPLLFQIINYY